DAEVVVRVRVVRLRLDHVAQRDHRLRDALLLEQLGRLLDGVPVNCVLRRIVERAEPGGDDLAHVRLDLLITLRPAAVKSDRPCPRVIESAASGSPPPGSSWPRRGRPSGCPAGAARAASPSRSTTSTSTSASPAPRRSATRSRGSRRTATRPAAP